MQTAHRFMSLQLLSEIESKPLAMGFELNYQVLKDAIRIDGELFEVLSMGEVNPDCGTRILLLERGGEFFIGAPASCGDKMIYRPVSIEGALKDEEGQDAHTLIKTFYAKYLMLVSDEFPLALRTEANRQLQAFAKQVMGIKDSDLVYSSHQSLKRMLIALAMFVEIIECVY